MLKTPEHLSILEESLSGECWIHLSCGFLDVGKLKSLEESAVHTTTLITHTSYQHLVKGESQMVAYVNGNKHLGDSFDLLF